ncbi:cyclin-dependent kinase inhibitor 7-like isoform X2 [Mangifera indica]|uniref:cyclin-dependent kinase inhibitor 7-like isoform X2 n=1 Tax=Mangifera indica TaxID=29780 RepID=UPI001CFC3D6F|nr:cyclin-dependent kinase inhibitor 7-like isoform X2 [Mangifera indica]
MGDCTKNTQRISGTAEEEMKEEEKTSNTSMLSKRTKFTSQQLDDSVNNDNEPSANNAPKKDHVSVKTVTSSPFLSAPRSSSNNSLQVVKDSLSFADLELGLRSHHNKFRVYLREVTSFETDVDTNNKNFRKASPLREICVGSLQASMDSQPNRPQVSPRRIAQAEAVSAARMPSLVEIDEFFAASEKAEQKRFAEKYNYDIVKDVPLEGRYQWIQLKQ